MQLEESEPGLLADLQQHHTSTGVERNAAPANRMPAHGEASGRVRKRASAERAGRNVLQKTGTALPDSWCMEEAGDVHEEPDTKQLCELLQQVLHDESLAQSYWQDIIKELTSEIQKVRAKDKLLAVPQDLIKAVLASMQSKVQEMTRSGKWEEARSGDGASEAAMCLDVANASLGFISHEELGPAIFTDELIETLIHFADGFINQVIVPAVEKALKDRLALESESAQGKRRKSREQSREVRGSLQKKVDSISHMMLLLGDVLRLRVKVQDPQCIALSRMCLGIFFVDFTAAVYHLQQACVGLMQTLFARYPDHREHILLDVVLRAGSWKPVPKDFCFQLMAPKLGSIQMISALLLSMLQSCCDDTPPVRSLQNADERAPQPRHPALMLLIKFITQVLQRMNKKVEKGGETGHKLLLQNLVADVCWVVGAPEWPVAPTVLRALWKYAYEMAAKESFPSQHRLDAAKLLGDIVVHMKQLLLRAKAPKLEQLRGRSSHSAQDNAVVQELIAQQVEILSRRASLVQQSPIQHVLGLGTSESRRLAEKLVSQQLLLNFLVARSPNNEALRHAKQNWIFMWNNDMSDMPPNAADASAKCYEWFWKDTNYLAHKRIDGLLDPSAQEALDLSSFLCGAYDFTEVLKPLLILLNHPKMPQFRQRALKALSQIIELDHVILANDVMRDAVCGSMKDPAKSVRAEAVSLVGKFMCNDQQLIQQYYEDICMRCRDMGSSVRKAAMSILRDLLTKAEDKRVIDRACVAIIPLLKDESDDICKRAFAFLREMWFPSSISDKDKEKGAVSGSVMTVAARFEQMRSVVDAAHKSNSLLGRDSLTVTDILEDFMKETLKAKKETVKECEDYCKEALQAIIRSQEDTDEMARAEGDKFRVGEKVEAKYKTGEWRSASIENRQGSFYKVKWEEGPQDDMVKDEAMLRMQYPDANLLSLFRTLALLARVRPELIVADIEILCKFLSQQERAGGMWSKGQCEMIGTVAAIYDCVLPHVQDAPDYLIKYLKQDLPMLIQYAPTMPLMSISIKCLCTMVKSVGSTRRRAPEMYTVVQKCFRYELERLKDPNFKRKPRSLIVAGLFCRFSDFKLHLESGKTYAIDVKNVEELFQKSITEFVNHEALAFQRAGFSCLGSLFVRKPDLIQRQVTNRVLDGALEQSSEDIRMLAISALTDFVGEDVSDTEATSLRNSVMQKFLNRILHCIYSEKANILIRQSYSDWT